MHIGDNLSRIRRSMELNQKELENLSGISRSQISRIESGDQKNPGIETLVALSTALGVSLEELVFGEQNPREAEYLLKSVEELDDDDKRFAKQFLKTWVISCQSKKLEQGTQQLRK